MKFASAYLVLALVGSAQAFSPSTTSNGVNTELSATPNSFGGLLDDYKVYTEVKHPVRYQAEGATKMETAYGGETKRTPSAPAPFLPSATVSKIEEAFPGALTNAALVNKLTAALTAKGCNLGKTLVATSLCCDEVNRPLETDLAAVFDTNFNMGGLAGFPFGGATSFGAMASHIPDGGDCVVVYGPHVGVDSTGAVGTTERRGKEAGGACCGSAVAASGYVAGVLGGDAPAPLPTDALDAQQFFVGSMLMPYADRLDKADEKMVELPYALYDAQTDLMKKILKKSGSAVGSGKTYVVGGVQINTPPGETDYFLPKSFEVYDNTGSMVEKVSL